MKTDKRRQLKSAAMPQVQRLVKQYGRTIIQGCLNKFRERESLRKKLDALKKEASDLERRL